MCMHDTDLGRSDISVFKNGWGFKILSGSSSAPFLSNRFSYNMCTQDTTIMLQRVYNNIVPILQHCSGRVKHVTKIIFENE